MDQPQDDARFDGVASTIPAITEALHAAERDEVQLANRAPDQATANYHHGVLRVYQETRLDIAAAADLFPDEQKIVFLVAFRGAFDEYQRTTQLIETLTARCFVSQQGDAITCYIKSLEGKRYALWTATSLFRDLGAVGHVTDELKQWTS